jgi:ATP-dependent DNA helicase RecG
MSRTLRIFISSVQKEFTSERRALKRYIQGDALLRRFFDVFLFEDLPASDRRADNVYLDQVDRCSIYLGLFGNEYGFEDATGVSPTEREFDRATAQGKTRLIYIKGQDDKNRHPKMGAIRSDGQ